MSKPVAHIIAHTHWDREWYMPYEKHHVRLIELMNSLLHLLETDESFGSFHLDGQTIILDDYLQVHPENRERIIRLIQNGRIIIGPWYILQDEFLTSSEANVRNLLVGHQDAKAYGPIAKIGYFPDSFGNMGQAPQLLQQAGIGNAIFGRGVKPTGANNIVADSAAFESPFSEMIWRAPDGSEVIGILFANWYSNGNEIPVEEDAAKAFWTRKLADVERFAATDQLLFMNGCDHQPVQADLTAALETARKLYPDYDFKISTLVEYVQAVEQSLAQPLTVIDGELRSQRTDGWGTLVNTASARVYIKQANTIGQVWLEKLAEPSAAMAAQLGYAYPHGLLTYAWKTLMQNHPHDSICGCSVDEVHAEMMTRFAKSRTVAETLVEQQMTCVADQVDTSMFSREGDVPFIVMNYAGQERTGVVSVELEVATEPLDYANVAAQYDAIAAIDICGGGVIVDEAGQIVPAEIEDLGAHFNYSLPDDRFRQPYMARRIRVTMHAEQVPALGHRAYAWRCEAAEGTDHNTTLASSATLTDSRIAAGTGEAVTLDNEYFTVQVNENGSLSLTDKETGHIYHDLCIYENVGDIGNEYIFKQDGEGKTLTTRDLKADVRLVSSNAFSSTVEITHHWEIPAEADATFAREKATMTNLIERKAGRSPDLVPLVITTRVTVEQGVKALKITAAFNNQAKDHRLRALFPTDIISPVHYADAIFELAERSTEPAAEWVNPSNAQHQQALVAVDSQSRGLAVANIGLNEYEVLRDGRNTIAVTLLRAVSELGDWGVFPTPEAQCLGQQEVSFAVIPYTGSAKRTAAAVEAYAYQTPWLAAQTGVHPGALPAAHSWLNWRGEHLALTAYKGSQEGGDLVVRWVNLSGEPTELVIQGDGVAADWRFSNILEEPLHALDRDADGSIHLPVGPHKIVTLVVTT